MEIGINGKVCGGGDNISTSCTGDHNQYADETVDTVDLSHNNIRPTPIVVVVVENNNNNNNNNDSNDNNNVNNNGNKNGNNNSNNNGNNSSNDDDVHDNVQKGLTDLRDLRTRWASVDQRQLKLGRHKRPIVPIGDMLSETLRARVVPPNRVEKITRDDSATQVRCTAATAAATSTVGERSRARSLPSRRLFSRNISYQQKIEPLGTAKGRRTLEQRPVPGRSSSVHDISTEIESASSLAKAELLDGQNQLSWYEDNDDDRAAAAAVRAAVVAECRRRFSALNLHANDEIVLTTLNVSLGPTTTTTDDNGNLRMGRNSLTTSIVREPTIVPSQCHLCYDELKRAEPVTLDDVTSPVTRRTFEADGDGDGNSDSSDAHCDSLDSPTACRSRGSSRRRSSANSGRSSGASSISSSSCREAVGTEQAQTRAAVINEIIQALSSVSFEGSADLKPSKPVKQVEITRNINDDSVSLAQTLGQTTMAPNETCVRQTNPPCRLPPPPITSTAAADAAAAAATTSPATTPGHLVMPAEMTQSLHRASSHFKRSASSTIHDALRSSRSCNDLNGNLAAAAATAAAAAERDQAAAKTRRQVVREVSGPMFKNSHSQTAFRVEPIGVLWEMASHDPLAPHALPIFAEVRVDRKTEIFRDERRHRHRRRRPRGGSLEDNNGNDESTTSDDSMLFTSDKGVGPDETFDDELRAAGLTDLNTTADSTLDDGDRTAEDLTQRSRSEERGIAWEILLNSAAPHDHMTLQEAFDAHCGDVKERSLSRLEKVAQIKLLRYDRDRIFEQYANMLPAHQKVKLDKDKVLFVFDDNQCVQQQQQQQSPSKTPRKRAKKQNNSLEKRKKSNRIVADIYKHRVRREVLAGKTTFPVSKIMLC